MKLIELRNNLTRHRIMWNVVIALLPAMTVSFYFFGISAFILTVTAIVSCLLFEFLIQYFFIDKEDITIQDGSAFITGVLLAFNVPSSLPIWMMVLGSLIAIGVGKMPYGGIGKNIFNPALVGRMFLLISFPVEMTTWPLPLQNTSFLTDAISGPTTLGAIREGMLNGKPLSDIMADAPSYMDMFMGNIGGSLGEVSAFAILIGALYMLYKKIITWHIPVTFITTVFVFTGILWYMHPDKYADPVFHVLAGGLILGATFIATDMVTSPMSDGGKIVFGIGCGVITVSIRSWGYYPEGVGFAILIMNAFTPMINQLFRSYKYRDKTNTFSSTIAPIIKNRIVAFIFIFIVLLTILTIVYIYTIGPINNAHKNSELDKIRTVLPAFDNNPIDSAKTIDELVFYTAKKGDSIVGYACKTFTDKGFNGRFYLLVGFKPDGIIYNTIVLEQHETPGFGDRMASDWNKQFNGKNLTEFNLKVKQDSGDVDAISASTISSRAYCDAIEKAYLSLMKNILKKSDVKLASEINEKFIIKDISILKKVLPAFDNDPLKEVKTISDLECFTAKKGGKVVGYAIKSSGKGYCSTVWILIGVLPDGKINGACFLENKETIGYGDKVDNPQFLGQFKGKLFGKCDFEVKKDDGDIDAVSGSTITSRAFCEAVAKASTMFCDSLSTTKNEVKKDSVIAPPSKPTIYQYTDKSIFNNVLPAFNNNPLTEFQSVNGLDVYTGRMNGVVTGYAITSFSKKGFGGKVIILVGFKPDGTINNTAFVSSNETPNFLEMVEEAGYRDQYIGKNPATFKLAIKSEGGDVDAVSGVTYTSRSFCDGVQKAYSSFINIKK